MNQKTERKKNVRPKNETENLDISEPFAFKHDLHISQEVYQERRVEDLNVFPQSPFLGRKENLREDFSMNSSISQVIETEVIPAIRSEIGDIVEKKIRFIFNKHNINSGTHHCQLCLCHEKKVIDEEEVQIEIKETKNAAVKKKTTSDEIQEDFDNTLVKSITKNKNQNHEKQLKDIKSFTSTPNSKESHDILRHFQHGEKLVKYGSDIQLDHDKHTEKEKAQGFKRTQTLPVSAYRTNLNRQHELLSHTGKALSKSDERKCLADALQWHVEELIDGIVFKDSELPDDLLADSCLTDEECADLRKTLDRKDQVRVLTSIIKGRDLKVLLRFLKHIKSQNEPVARSIEEKFEHNKKTGVRCSECALCNLTSNVNAKYIADRLWKYNLIDSGLYNWIVQSDKPTGVQGEMWRGIINSLNFHCKKHRSDVCQILSSALTKNNHYHHVAKGLERMINIEGEMDCYCAIRLNTVHRGSLPSSDEEESFTKT
ncbi:uncharacterized protein LOC132752181 [Ruditapes philippinarum]|uniref:uncharacterized protein LOC132752181 n=1 Tax=Ruditapes philippinarum TaxID=129788 RepID=UPI00295B58C6|nr:uncharacterized protein LOC132752181 [Ruditapes philippinarum]